MPEGCSSGGVEIVNACGLPAWQACVVEIVQVCAGLRGVAWWSGDHASLCRPEGHGPVEVMSACGSPAWQALGA
jgi:hypothetical protein